MRSAHVQFADWLLAATRDAPINELRGSRERRGFVLQEVLSKSTRVLREYLLLILHFNNSREEEREHRLVNIS